MDYTDTRWPWRVKVVKTDGTVTEGDYSEEFDPVGFARERSNGEDVERVEVSVAFVKGEAVAIVAATGRETGQ